MSNTIRIKRRASGVGAGAPSSLYNAELAFNEGDLTLYYGLGAGGDGGTATSVIPIAGSGAFTTVTTTQTITGDKTFNGAVSFGGTVNGLVSSDVGLGNVTNESKTTMFSSPVFTGTPTAPTATAGSSSVQIATTAFVATEINNIDYSAYATLASPTFTGTVTIPDVEFTGEVVGLVSSDVGLGNVTNESKATMFNNPAFTGTVTGVSKAMVGLGNVTNESKATMFTDPTFTGTVSGVSAAMVGLGNVTNESKGTMFDNPTFTGTVSGVTQGMVGLGNVTNESKETMFSSPAFTGTFTANNATFSGTVEGITQGMVGLGNVTNESKATMFTNPTFTGTVSGVSAAMVGLGNVDNESKATMFTDPTFTGTVSGVTAAMVGLGNVTNESKATMFTAPEFTGSVSIESNLTVGGDLTVNGTLTSINSTTVSVDDKNLELGSTDTPTDETANGGGITLKGSTDKTIIWDSTNSNWTSSEHVNVASGKVFKVDNVEVLSATALGSTVVASSLTSVGTITTGVWNGTKIGVAYGGTNLSSYTAGDMVYASGTTTLAKLAKGTAGQFLSMNAGGTAPEWTNVVDGGTF